MPWATFLLFLVGGYITAKLFSLAQSRERLKFTGLTISACLLTVVSLCMTLSPVIDADSFTSFVIEWGHITALAFVLSSLAVFIRESKPVFAQFPLLYTALPLLIVISYLLVHNTYALKNWLLAIYQGGAITVALLMYSVYSYRRKEYTLVLVGITVLLFSHVLYWYVPQIQESYNWIWQILLAVGLIVTVKGYQQSQTKQAKAKVEPTKSNF